ncbi:MAG: hypothetical protein JNK64_27840 [Myxococcales bacterium]|nr:hypothetical protein [Myxococcales bacterium]
MLSFRRATWAPALAAGRGAYFLLHPALRVYVVASHGLTHEKRLYAGTTLAHAPGRRQLAQLVLDGALRLGDGAATRWLGPGELSLQPRSLPDERWQGARFAALVVEWTPAPGAIVPRWTTGALAPALVAWSRAWSEALIAAPPATADAARATAALLDRWRAAGVPLPALDAAALAPPVPPAIRTLATALGDALSDLAARPMLVDLEARCARSGRHLRRELADFDRYYGFPGGTSWHRVSRWWRLSMATCLMTARGATTEGVAAALGYGSPQAFCLAMAHAGLPSPGQVAAAAARQA